MQTGTGRRTDVRRLLGLMAVLGLLTSVGMATAPTAFGKIVIGQSIDGVKLGASEAQVKRLVGKPSACEPCSKKEVVWRYVKGFEGNITFNAEGRVTSMWTGSVRQRTSKGIHANGFSGHGHGSSAAEIRQAYPTATCEELPDSEGFTNCELISDYHGHKVITDFLVKAAFAGVAEISIGFG